MEILVAYTGAECLEIVAENQPDLILLDVMMPDMDGIETCQRLKANPETETIPIVFITAKASKEGKLEGLGAGAVDYITKPIDLDETLARVRTQLRLQEMFRENLELQERLGNVRKAAAVGAITKGIAHNLNNLLGVVVGYLDLIKNGYDSPDMVKRSVNLMDNSVNRMITIIHQLGTIAGNERIELSSLNINDVIDRSIERFKSDYNVDSNVVLKNEIDADASVSANAEIFEIIVGKLLINAWESYPSKTIAEDRFISLHAKISKERGLSILEITIKDEGEGLDPKIVDIIFEPFTTTKTAVGRGMGLSTARHAMRNLSGDLQVKPNPDGGVSAILSHPL